MTTTKKRVEVALAARRRKALADRDAELVALAKVDAALVELHQRRVEVGRALREALEVMSPRTLGRETGLKAAERRVLLALVEEPDKAESEEGEAPSAADGAPGDDDSSSEGVDGDAAFGSVSVSYGAASAV